MSLIEHMQAEAEKTEKRVSGLIEGFNNARLNEEVEDLEKVFDTVSERTDELVVNSQLAGLELGVNLELAKLLFASLPVTSDRCSAYRFSFETYAAQKASSIKTQSARSNLMRAARVFVLNRHNLSVPKGIEFNPWLVPPSNLITTAHKAETGTLSEKAWAMLSKPDTKYRELVQQMHVDDKKEDKLPMSDDRVLYFDTGVLYFKDISTGETVGLAEFEDDESPSYGRGVALLTEVIKAATADKVSKLLKEHVI